MRYLIVTKGLQFINEANKVKDVKKEIKNLKKMGYKRPLVYQILDQDLVK